MTRLNPSLPPRARGLAALVAVCLLAGAASAQTTYLDIVPPTGTFMCGETWTIEVTVDAGATDLRGYSLVLEYDNNIIQPLNVYAGSLVTGASCPYFLHWFGPSTADSLYVDVANLGCSVAGPGAILTVEFEGFFGGTSNIDVRGGALRTGANQPIAFTSDTATVNYLCAVAEERTAWGALKAIFR